MFDSGFLELLVVGIIALIVIGPERLPEVATKVGKFIGKIKAFVATTRDDIEREMRADELKSMLAKQKEEIGELRDMMKSTKTDISSELNEASQLLDESMKDAQASARKK